MIISRYRLNEISRKRPEQMTVADIADLVGAVDQYLTYQEQERQRNLQDGNAIAHDALGFEHRFSLYDHGWQPGGQIPATVKFPVHVRIGESFRATPEAYVAAVNNGSAFRVFALRDQTFTGMPIYRERA